jgi:glycosyltransferase involved in cell wall biosynthesis
MHSLDADCTDISVIIPVYNRALYLQRAVASTLQNDGIRIEVVVVDDGSTDDSAEVARAFGPPVRVLPQPNAGPAAARNRGFAESRGRFVRFLDSDDWLLPGANDRQLAALDRSGADVCYGNWRDAFEGQGDQDADAVAGLRPSHLGDHQPELQSMGPVSDPVEALLGDRWCPNFCYLLRRESVCAAGGWDEDRALIGIEDFDFILRVALRGARFTYLHQDVGRYFQHAGPRTSRDSLMGWCVAKRRILERAIHHLESAGGWTDGRRHATAYTLLRLAKQVHGLDRDEFAACLSLLRKVAPRYRPPGALYPIMVRILGYERAEAILEARRCLWAAGGAGRHTTARACIKKATRR